MSAVTTFQVLDEERLTFQQRLFEKDHRGGTFSILDVCLGKARFQVFTSNPDDLLELAENATQLAHKLARQLQADEAARAVLATA
jgi:hypothetical protein